MSAPPRLGLALGGGGARGLAHLVVLEAFDERGLRPAVIAGASIGAVIGAAYAAGYGAAALRHHVLRLFRDRAGVMTRLFRARVGKVTELFSGGLRNPALLDAEALLKAFWPPGMPDRFADLRLPLRVVASDVHSGQTVVFDDGPLRPAIAASMAVPGLVRPVSMGERVLIDGVATDPLPFEHLRDVDRVLAVDVIGSRSEALAHRVPTPLEATLLASQLLQRAVVEARLAATALEVTLIRPPVAQFGALEFFSARRILAAGETIRGDVHRWLMAPADVPG